MGKDSLQINMSLAQVSQYWEIFTFAGVRFSDTFIFTQVTT